MEDVTSAIVRELTRSCAECGINSDIIDEQSFACFPESPTHVTLRARLRGSSETDSDSLISLLESWVSGGATIIVTGVLMTVDPECSVAITSLSEGECSMTTTHPPDTTASSTTTSSHSSTDNTAAITGGVVVAVVLIIVVAVLIFGIVALRLVLKNRRGELSIRKTEEWVDTSIMALRVIQSLLISFHRHSLGPLPPVPHVVIGTRTNTAYKMKKQGGQGGGREASHEYELASTGVPRAPMASGVYEVPSPPPTQQPAAVSSRGGTEGEGEVVYEHIPGDQ